MTLRNGSKATLGCFLAVVTGLVFLCSCGGGSSSSSPPPPPPASGNTATVTVGISPTGRYLNEIFTSVTICQPNTSNCQTVDNVLVDTGSMGLRILNSALTTVPASSLAAVTDPVSGDAIQECIQYGDTSYTWGPMLGADVELAGEKTSEIAINVIGGNSFSVPSACITTPISSSLPNGGNDDTVDALGANGILGIAGYPWDCGSYCESVPPPTDDPYYICPSGVCGQVAVATGSQATNPVAAFSSADNNGVLITLPSIPATGAASGTVSGSLIFGIGTQSDNALASTATVYGVDDHLNIPEATYNGVQYTSPSLGGNNTIILDTGSNGIFFLDATTLASAGTGIVECADASGFYCPGTTVPFTVTLSGYNSTSGTITFSIANADTLFASGNAAFNDLGGDGGTAPSTDFLDFGLPIFFGRSVYVGMWPGLWTTESPPPSAASSAAYGYYAF
jgi:hypothetical protein